LQEAPDPLRLAHEVNPAVPPHVSEVLRRALALKRDQRPESAASMRTMLREAGMGIHPMQAPGGEATMALPDQGAPPLIHPLAHVGRATVPGAPETRVAAAQGRSTVSEAPVTLHAQPPPRRSSVLPFALGVVAALVLLAAASVGAYFAFVNMGDSDEQAATNSPSQQFPAVSNTPGGPELPPVNVNAGVPAANMNAPVTNANVNRPPVENSNAATNRPENKNANSNTRPSDDPGNQNERPETDDEDEGGDRPHGRRPVRISGGELESKAVRRSFPLYTDEMREEGARGPVLVDVLVSESGEVLRARVASGHPLLNEQALSAARRWRFSPTLVDGEPVKVFGTLRIPFQQDRQRDDRRRRDSDDGGRRRRDRDDRREERPERR
jgi:periplasmic protein TonB